MNTIEQFRDLAGNQQKEQQTATVVSVVGGQAAVATRNGLKYVSVGGLPVAAGDAVLLVGGTISGRVKASDAVPVYFV